MNMISEMAHENTLHAFKEQMPLTYESVPEVPMKKRELKVLMISMDRKIFEEQSPVRRRIIEYGLMTESLHVIVYTKKGFPKFTKLAANVWVYPTNSFSRWLYVFDAIRIALSNLKWKGKTLVNLVSTQDSFDTGIAGMCIAKYLHAKFHVQVHTDFLDPYFKAQDWLNALRVMIAKRVLSKATSVRVVSEKIKTALIALNPYFENRVVVLPIFTDTEALSNAPITVDLHKKYPQFSFIILMASRLTVEKDIVLGIDVLKELLNHIPRAGLVIVGEGPLRGALQTHARSLGVEKNVIFEGWQEDLSSYYKTANLFLLTSRYEGYGLTLVEAAACGCPIIATNVGIATSLIKNGQNGFVVASRDRMEFVRRIMEIINTPGMREHMSINAKDFVTEQIGTNKEEYLKRYKQMWQRALELM
jgi:glycosyltransferase involved in cell wall biosynthesis